MKLTIRISKGIDGWFVASVREMPGCISQGRTMRSALRNICEAIEAVQMAMAKRVA